MLKRYRNVTLIALLVVLAGCAGNYSFSDDEYRPLGTSKAEKRGS